MVKGSSDFFSLMFSTILSSPSDVICFSFPRLKLNVASSPSMAGLKLSVLEGHLMWFSILSTVSDAADSTLTDNSGISFDSGLDLGTANDCDDADDEDDAVVVCFGGSTQNVSLFHSLQLKFSNLLPSSI